MKPDYSKFVKKQNEENLFGAKVNKYSSLYLIKNKSNFKQLCKLIDENKHGLRYVYDKIFGNPLPTGYDKLGLIGKNRNVIHADNLESEINWTLLCVRKYKVEIALFIEYRAAFEDAFFVADYETAEHFLSKIEKEICVSIWSLQSRMLLLEFKESPESHKSFLSDINTSAKGFFIPYLAHFISNRSERNLSVSRYDIDINNALQRLKGSSADESKEFYYFKLNRCELKKYKCLKEILTYDGYHSVIDRYLSLIETMKICLSNSDVGSETKSYVIYRLKYLKRKFKDPELKTLFHLHFQEFQQVEPSQLDIKIVDLFTLGIYEECINLLGKRLIEYPSVIEYYVMYVKSFLYSGKVFELPSKNKCFQNTLLNDLFNFLNKKVDPFESIVNLQRLERNLHEFRIVSGIRMFVDSEIYNDSDWHKFNILSLQFNNPEVVNYYGDINKAKDYLNYISSQNNYSVTARLNFIKFEDNFETLLNQLNIPSLIKSVEIGKFYLKASQYDNARKEWEQVTSLYNHIAPIYELAIGNLFYTYVELGLINEAVKLYVDKYLESSFLVFRIDTSKIHEQVRKKKFRNVNANIDLALFYTFSKADENELHIAYERFNQSVGIQLPSQLVIERLQLDKNKWIKFLHLTCTTEIFKHSIYINGSKEGYSERILVCKTLLSLDELNSDTYKSEIQHLTDVLIIQEGLQQLDESKIYVNEQGLLNSELKEYEGLYNRYKTISNIYKTSNKQIVVIDRKKGVRLASLEDLGSGLTEQYSSDPLRDVFEDIFDVITRKFLFSKFGISAYLSTRIRHGVLLGETRPIFERYNLISQKDSHTDKYQDIEYWKYMYLSLTDIEVQNLQSILSSFSETIDNIILELIKDQLQIKTDDENFNGWFDYYFDETVLAIHAIKCRDSKDYSDFVRMVTEILWERTDKNLGEIRRKIQVEVKAKFNEAIEQLVKKIQNSFFRKVPEIITNATSCLTEIQNALDRIAGWFNRSGSQTSDFKLDKLLTVVINNVSHSYPRRNLELKHFDVPDITLRGEFYTHFADLFRIFLDNTLKHSDQDIDTIDIEIVVEKIGDYITVIIKNTHPISQSSQKVAEHSNINLNLKKLSTEGKSGFPKADKIIRSDLKNDSNSYKFYLDLENKFVVILSISLEILLV